MASYSVGLIDCLPSLSIQTASNKGHSPAPYGTEPPRDELIPWAATDYRRPVTYIDCNRNMLWVQVDPTCHKAFASTVLTEGLTTDLGSCMTPPQTRGGVTNSDYAQ